MIKRALVPLCLIVVALATAVRASDQQTADALQPAITRGKDICIILQDYTGLSSTTLNATKQEITSIFGEIDIRVAWNLPNSTKCHNAESLSIVFNIEPQKMGSRLGLGDNVVGAALPCTAEAQMCYGYLLYDNLRSLFGPKISETKLIAFVAAHEIGHVLLGGDHSMDGVMAGLWNSDYLLRARAGALLFSAEEGVRIRARLHVPQTSPPHAG